jgi:hypothetical protein
MSFVFVSDIRSLAVDDLQARTPKRLMNALLEIRCAHSDDIYLHIRPSRLQTNNQASGESAFFGVVMM